MKKTKKPIRPKTKKSAKKNRPKRSSNYCEKFDEQSMCYRCLDISRELVLCGELDEDELKRVRKIMKNIIDKKGVLKKDVELLGFLSENYLN